MKIRRISLLNLNSLRGEHSVDLAGEPLAGAGLFAITGPTGAGKTTLLDAVTLALYGRAARYGSEPNPEDMMSRHTGECRAEVEFEVDGKTFRAAWHLHRARGAPEGKVQPPKRSVYDAAGEPLTQKLRDADAKVEEICGLDYQRFMRSVLLAQGDFARFLKARPDERAALLESLTGTGIYSELSALAHEEHARRERELSGREAALGLVQTLPQEERAELEDASKAAGVAFSKARTANKARAESLADAEALATARGEEAKLAAMQGSLTSRREKAKDTFSRLAAHRAAAPFNPDLEKANAATAAAAESAAGARSAADTAAAAAEAHTAALAAALATGRKQIEIWEKAADRARETANTADKARAAAASWLAEHTADSTLKDALPEIASAGAAVGAARKALSDTRSAQTRLTAEKSKVAEAAQGALTALRGAEAAAEKATNAAAALDPTGLRKGLEALQALRTKDAELRRERAAREEHQKQTAAGHEQLPALRQAETDAAGALADAEKQVELIARHLSDARLLASFDEQRADLKDGDPCPLCGASEHPLCDGGSTPTAPAQLDKELGEARAARDRRDRARAEASKKFTSLEARLSEVDKTSEKYAERIATLTSETTALAHESDVDLDTDLAAEEKRHRAKLADAEEAAKRSTAAAAELQRCKTESRAAADSVASLERRLAEAADQITGRAKEVDAAAGTLAALLKPFGVDAPQEGDEPALRETLAERAAAFVAQEKGLANAKDQLAAAQQDERAAAKELKSLRGHLAKLGDRPPDPTAPVSESFDEALETVRAAELDAKAKAATAAERKRSLKAAEKARDDADRALAEALDGSGFADTAALRAVRLDAGAATAAETLERELSDSAQQLKGALTSCRSTIEKLLIGSPPEGEALAVLREEVAGAEEQIEKLSADRAELNAALKSDDALRARQSAAAKELADDREQLGVWARLSALIGSHDGKKFRVYAQGLSLDLLLHHANAHLKRLEPRYLLARHAEAELEVEIIDTHQAAAVRPMNSLSGGESFLASLALALGLSDLAGRNVQIDSLFIDEGFGTLDSATLDTALSALESLRTQHKTVGVISHVEMLKERIGVQIAVERAPDGSSTLRVTA